MDPWEFPLKTLSSTFNVFSAPFKDRELIIVRATRSHAQLQLDAISSD